MYKKTIALFLVVMAFALFQKVTIAEFNSGQFAASFGQESVILLPGGSGEVKKVIMSLYHYPVEPSLLDAYAPSTTGEIDPSRPWDIGMFHSMGASGYVRDAYYYGDDIYFSSFVLTSTPSYLYEYRATLSYDNGATRTSGGTAINLGVAYLYSRYATGDLSIYDYTNNSTAAEFNEALQFLLGNGSSGTTWTSNRFLNHLVTESGNSSVWLQQYDLNTTYPAWVDNDYAVYVMNLSQIDYDRLPELYPPIPYLPVGDVLYLVRRDSIGGVPEPATVFLWTCMSVGLFGAARHRRKRMA